MLRSVLVSQLYVTIRVIFFFDQDPPSPPPAGKNLLWRSRSAAPSPLSHLPAQATPLGTPPRQMDPYRQSVATNVGLRPNPFQQNGKRIASGARVASVFSGHGISSSSASPGLTDSTNGSSRNNGYKTFSKWEKQDLEAKAMMKMREANMKKQAEKEQKEREEREKAEKEKKEKEAAAAAAAAAKPIPTITITTPAEAKAPQTEPKASIPMFAPTSSSESTKGAATAKQTLFWPASAPSFTLGNAPSLKSEDKPPAKSATPQPSGSTFFTNLSSGLPAKPTAPLPGGGVTTDNKPPQSTPQSTFSFPAPSTDSTAGNSTRPAFQFNLTPSQPPRATEGLKDGLGATDSGSGSLLARITPSAQPQQSSFSFGKPAADDVQKPTSIFGNTNTQVSSTLATTISTTSKPKFDFGVSNKPLSSALAPAAPTSSLSDALGNNTVKPASTGLSFNFKVPAAPAGGTSGANTGTTAAKFSFGATSAGETSSFAGNKASAPATAPQTSEAQTKPLSFGTTSFTPAFGTSPFGSSKDSADTAVPQSSENQTNPSPFGATITSSTSPFGTPGGSKGSAPAAASQSNESQNTPSAFNTANSSSASPFGAFGGDTAASKPAFIGFGNGTQGTLGTTGFGAGSTAFGSSGSSNVFGGSGAVAKPAETPKTTFSWSTTPSSTPTATNTGEASGSTFAFGGQAATPVLSTPAANGNSSFATFKFGDSLKASTTPSTTLQASQPFAAGQSLFGGTPAGTTPSAFGFGAPSTANGTSTTGSSGLFGNPPASAGQQQQ